MHRLSSWPDDRRVGTVAAAVVVTLAPLVLLAGAQPTFAADGQVTITFSGTGPEPLVCTSYPEPASVSIKVGTAVAVENRTGVSAEVDIGTADPVPLADGEGLTLKLKKGTHELRLVPSCLVVQAGAATVNVADGSDEREPGTNPAAEEPDPTRAPPATTPATDGRASTTSGAAPTTTAPVGGPASGGGASGSGSGTGADRPVVAAAPEAVPADAPALEGGPVLEQVGPYPLPRRDNDDRGKQLLGVIAAICVLGVTAGIIRAILAQQASGAAGT
jgi:hypothetical protein